METSFDLERQKAINLENELKLSQTQNTLRQRTTWLYSSIIGMITLLIIGWLYFSNMKKKRELQQQFIQRQEAEHQVMLLQEHNAGQEKERTRISRELHDNIGGLLVAAKLQLQNTDGESGVQVEKVNTIIEKAQSGSPINQSSPGTN